MGKQPRSQVEDSGRLLSNSQKESFLSSSERIQVFYDVRINAKVQNQTKTILQRQSGLLEAGAFTAIMGPSGSGKTTLLNFLSGRLMSDNLVVEAQLRMNGVSVKSIQPYSNQIGYVMQEDTLLGVLTPRQCFQFACNLKVGKPQSEKKKIVEQLINSLSLLSCADVKVGNTFIKGISGGQRKRTSIGVELITNPSIIFLDEPTTGLDSTTSLQVILLLKDLAKEGKTVVSTIHQPSSQLFCEFDKLMLLVDGRCIYLGSAQQSYGFFASQGYQCPQLMNASEFYLDIMSITDAQDLGEDQSYQQARQKHDEKVLKFQSFYLQSKFHNIQQNQDLKPIQIKKEAQISLWYELILILRRAVICQVRNPMDVFFKTIQSIFTALIVLLVFGKIGAPDDNNFQNVRGVIFFLVANNAFGGIQGTLAVFSSQKPVFLRQRFSKSYKTVTYFVARTAINFPFQLIYPTVCCVIVYFGSSLGDGSFMQCLKLIIVINCVYFCAASYGLLYAAIIPKLETAMAMVPVLIIPFMLLGGFFINLENINDIRVIFYPVMYLSPFKYGFQAGIDSLGIDTLKEPRKPADLFTNCILLLAIGFFFRIVSIFGMQIISNPKRPKLQKLQEEIGTQAQNSQEKLQKNQA